MKRYVNWAIFAGVGLLLALGVTLFHYFILPIAIRYQVTKTLALENGTESWERFMVTPIPIVLKLYFFKLANPEEVMKGSKPRVIEVGPYVYREQWHKEEVRIDEAKDTIFYRQAVDFTFDSELSAGLTENDNITTANAFVHSLMSIIDALPTVNVISELLEFGLPELIGDNIGPTMTIRLRDLLFDGIVIPCNKTGMSYTGKFFCSALRNYQPISNAQLDQYGNPVVTLLKFKELGPMYELSRGTNDVEKLGKVVSMDGKTKLDSWRCDSANMVAGYDMVMFPPFLTKSSVIPFFTSDLRTSINMVYSEDSSYAGIGGYKFGMGKDFLADVMEDPNAKCYCPGSARNLTIPRPCLPGKGVIDLSSSLNVPVILSLPHLYRASENWQKTVDGLSPSREKHESYLSIEPTTGVPLEGFRRVQINMLTKPLPAMKAFRNHAEALIPLLWLEEGTGLGDKEISMLRDQLLKVLNIVMIVRWSLFSVGLAMLIAGTLMAIWRWRQDLAHPLGPNDEED